MEAAQVRQRFVNFCLDNGLLAANDSLVVGVSGGPDSLCLLHLLVELSPQLNLSLIVAHLDHQLRGRDSQADALFVQEMADRWQLPCYIEVQPIADLARQRRLSVEEAARQFRYAFLWRVASRVKASKVAVGHNADDQAETVLMHFIRGSGLAGLRGMLPDIGLDALRLPSAACPVHDSQTVPRLVRPLLEISRSEIELYCSQHRLFPRYDSSNQDTTYFRNRLRHELIPQLTSYNPNIRQVLGHTAKVVAADAQLLAAQLQETWARTVESETPDEIVFDLAGWSALPLGLKRSTLRHALYRLRPELRDIGFVPIENAIKILEKGQTGARVSLGQDLMLTISYQTFAVTAGPIHKDRRAGNQPHLSPGQVVRLTVSGPTALPSSAWKVVSQVRSGQDIDWAGINDTDRWEALLDADAVGSELILRTRQPGDRFCPLGLGGHSQKIADFMINEKIPRTWRDQVPLLVSRGKIWWVCGYRPDDRARIRQGTKRVLSLRFERD